MSSIASYGAARGGTVSGLTRVYDKTLEGVTVNETVPLAPESLYLACSEEITISTGAVRGTHCWLVATADATAQPTDATRISVAASTNSGITSSVPASGGFVWRCTSSSYRVRLVIYKL